MHFHIWTDHIPEITEWLYGFSFFVVGAVVHLDGFVMRRYKWCDSPCLLSASTGSLDDGPGTTRTSAALVGSGSQLTSREIPWVPSDWLRAPDAEGSAEHQLHPFHMQPLVTQECECAIHINHNLDSNLEMVLQDFILHIFTYWAWSFFKNVLKKKILE